MNKNVLCHPISQCFWNERNGSLIVSNGTLGYCNFRAVPFGAKEPAESKEQRDNVRSFKVFIDDPAVAQDLNDRGYSISAFNDQETGKVYHLLKVKVSFRYWNPDFNYIRCHAPNGVVTEITEDTVADIDADYRIMMNGSVTMELRPGKTQHNGVYSLYLTRMDYAIKAVDAYEYTYQFPEEAKTSQGESDLPF